ncbi:TetR/AcrR family transcriptional regulator [candidate division KSB1 bacterium]|nr:TetR/AcrR family transcriptional regulator [candidate division KSB1 bacterium]
MSLADQADRNPAIRNGADDGFDRILNRIPEHLRPPEPGSPRGRILSAARRLFAEQGLEATSTREIADAAEVNLAMIHYYFGSKEQLYRRTIAGMILELFQQVADSIQAELPPAQRLMQFPLLIMKAMRDSPTTAAIMRREIANGAPQVREVVRSLGELGPQGFAQVFAALYHEAVASGEVRSLPVDAVREFVISLAYSSVFMGPLFQLIPRENSGDPEIAWQERHEVFAKLLQHALLVEPKST